MTAASHATFAVLGTAVLAYTHLTTKQPIAEAEAKIRLALFSQLLPSTMYDNDLLSDAIRIDAGVLGNEDETWLYRARLNGAPSAIILQTTAPDGYSGAIKLLVAVQANGELAGVRVLAHKETPGLGDYIEVSHGQWILQFNGRSLFSTADDGWKVKKDGGQFDYVTGATITPRAVIKAVHGVLIYFKQNQQQLFDAPTEKGAQA